MKELQFGVRSQSNGKLVAYISGVPTLAQVNDRKMRVVEINFLCVHKKLRSKRLAPVLIKEVTRRANLNGIFQAVFTSGTVLPVPVATTRYYHRNLNPKKLVKVGFSSIPKKSTLARMTKELRLAPEPACQGLRPMELKDVDAVCVLLNSYLSKFKMKILFTREEIEHWLLPKPNVINSYVVEKDGKITDFCSFYHLPSSILHFDETLHAAYAYYNVATSMSLVDLMRDCLILARDEGFDVFNCLNIMENEEFLDELKFGKGDGYLQYYVFNWSCPEMKPPEIGLVML